MKVVFFDRDGVLIRDPEDYRVKTVDDIELFPDTVSALRTLAENDYSIVIITNQAGIEEGLISEEQFWTMQEEVLSRIKPSGVKVLKTFMNGEMDKPDASEWRKPGPNMLLDAIKEFDLEPSEIYMFGDNQSDVTAALRAGCKGGILIKTATNKDVVSSDAAFTAQNLTEAVQFIISKQ